MTDTKPPSSDAVRYQRLMAALEVQLRKQEDWSDGLIGAAGKWVRVADKCLIEADHEPLTARERILVAAVAAQAVRCVELNVGLLRMLEGMSPEQVTEDFVKSVEESAAETQRQQQEPEGT